MNRAPTVPDPREERALAAVDGEVALRILGDLVAIPSLPAAETPAQHYVAEVLDSLGADVDVFALDQERLRAHPAHSAEVERTDPLGVVATVGDGSGPTLLLNGHVDVVPTGDPGRWSSPPFTPVFDGRRLFGRGACDMKGGIAAGLTALHALRAAGVRPGGRVEFLSVVGEEDGGSGTLGALLHGVTADAAVVLEPTNLAVAPAVAGALSFSLSVRGRAAHGCLREEGISAIEKFAPLHHAIVELEATRNARAADELFGHLDRPFAICTGRVEAGDWASSEADWLRAEGRYGVAPDEELEAARDEFEQAIAAAAASDPWLAAHPPQVAWVGGQFLPARTAVDEPVVTAVRGAARDAAGTDGRLEGQPYGCDMGLLRGVGGIPTVVFGPGDIRQAHTVDEWVDVGEVVQCARALVVTILRFCG